MSLQADHALDAWLCDQCNKTYTNLGQHLRRCRPDRGARAVPAQPIPDLYRPDPTADLLNIAKEEMFFNWYYRVNFSKNLKVMNSMFTGLYVL